MRKHMKRGLSLLLVLVMLVSAMSGLTISASAATTDYVYNWGTRGTTATYLSDAAQEFYESNGTSYAELSALSGSSTLSSVSSSALYKELQDLMVDNHTYITSYSATRDLFQYTDCENGGGTISSFYSGLAIGPAWDGSTWNREHTWPNSKGLGGSDEDDLMMLRPTASTENSARGNTAYGESSGYYNPNSESNGAYDLRGDVARIFLYVYVRWGNVNGNSEYGTVWGTSGVIESLEVLLKWMEEDPVDTWELGRNDSVESITGTRNVFVDYPELAFQMFGEEIPSDMITPSGEAVSGSGYTITAVSNDEALGTVTVSGKIIRTSPIAGYEAVGYEVIDGTAVVAQDGNAFMVNASSDCTVRINFGPRTYTGVRIWENGTLSFAEQIYVGDSVTLPDPVATPEDYTFVGWCDSVMESTTEYPSVCMAPGSSYAVSGQTDLYAIYSYSEEGGTGGSESYVLVTDASQLVIGSSVVIAALDYDVALSTTQNGNNRGQADVIKNSDGTITWVSGSGVAELTLGAGTVDGTYSFYCDANSGYLYCASGSSSGNYLRTQSSLDAAASFAVTLGTDGSCTLTSQKSGVTRNLLQYNYGNSIFSCYMTSSNQKPISLYVKTSEGSATYYTTGQTPEINTAAITAQPGSVTAGVGETVYFTVTAAGDGLTYQWQYRASSAHGWSNTGLTGNKTATLEVPVTAARNGMQYRCVVTDEYGNVVYSDAATLTVAAAASITTQPADKTAAVGETVYFTVTAAGDGLTYQWQYRASSAHGWSNTGLTGNKTASLEVPVTAARNGMQYRCVVTDAYGNVVYSDAAALTVAADLAITTQPADKTATVGETVYFTVTASGTGLTYQWQYRASSAHGWSNTGLTGNKTASLEVPVTAARNGMQYRCVVTDASGSVVYSDAVTLTVSAGLAITTQPADKTVSAGETVHFTVTATGTGLTYQWQYRASSTHGWSNTGLTGNKTATLEVPATTARNGMQYRCVVTDASGSVVYSDAVTLTVTNGLSITAQPESLAALVGETVYFNVTASGSGLTYQWQYRASSAHGWSNTGLTGNKTATLEVPVTAARNGMQYRCVVTDASGNVVYSDAVTLTACTGLTITAQSASKTASAGETVHFTVTAVGSGLTYQWQYRASSTHGWSNTGLTGNKTATLEVPVTAARNGMQYRCVVTDASGNVVYSDAVTLTVS